MYGHTGSGYAAEVLEKCVLVLHASMAMQTPAPSGSQLHAAYTTVLHQAVWLQITPWYGF
jgi:hypothetical protein